MKLILLLAMLAFSQALHSQVPPDMTEKEQNEIFPLVFFNGDLGGDFEVGEPYINPTAWLIESQTGSWGADEDGNIFQKGYHQSFRSKDGKIKCGVVIGRIKDSANREKAAGRRLKNRLFGYSVCSFFKNTYVGKILTASGQHPTESQMTLRGDEEERRNSWRSLGWEFTSEAEAMLIQEDIIYFFRYTCGQLPVDFKFLDEIVLKKLDKKASATLAKEKLEKGLAEINLPKGLLQSLQAKLNAFNKNQAKGEYKAAQGNIKAFLNELSAQRGKHLSEADYLNLNAFGETIKASLNVLLGVN